LTVFLVDDNSPDGTAAAVHARFPQVRVLQGNGNLFWCGGMRLAFDAALKDDFDFYIWLNDDTFLEHDAIERLLKAYQSIAAGGQEAAIVVGSTRDPETGALTYGGIVRSSRIHPIKYRLLEPGDRPIQCDTMNGNFVLVPRAVVTLAHNLSAEFQHALGDFDYGLRARKAGCTVWVAPGFIGTCAWNAITGGFLDTRSSFRNRWQHMMSNKGLPPGEYLTYVRRHGGPLWPLFWALPYVRVVFGLLRRNREICTA
jgi:GT2 family glycosyltransferase